LVLLATLTLGFDSHSPHQFNNIFMAKENYLVQVNNKEFVVAMAKDAEGARQHVLDSHSNVSCVRTIDTVENVLEKLKPYIVISKHAQM
jgi:hypothetical protein